jgi:hypothetical protein
MIKFIPGVHPSYKEQFDKYYIYRHVRIDTGEVFYIGVGTKLKRFRNYEREFYRAFCNGRDSGRGSIWKNIAAKTKYEVEVLGEFDSYESALKKEVELISLYGRINISTGTLANLTDGGKGMSGFTHTQESRKKMSLSKSGKKKEESTVLKGIQTRRANGWVISDEQRRKVSAAMIGNKNGVGKRRVMV